MQVISTVIINAFLQHSKYALMYVKVQCNVCSCL